MTSESKSLEELRNFCYSELLRVLRVPPSLLAPLCVPPSLLVPQHMPLSTHPFPVKREGDAPAYPEGTFYAACLGFQEPPCQ